MIDGYTKLICIASHRLFRDKLFCNQLFELAGQFLANFILPIARFRFLDGTNALNMDK